MPTNKAKIKKVINAVVERYSLRSNRMAMTGVTMAHGWLEKQSEEELEELLKKVKSILDD